MSEPVCSDIQRPSWQYHLKLGIRILCQNNNENVDFTETKSSFCLGGDIWKTVLTVIVVKIVHVGTYST